MRYDWVIAQGLLSNNKEYIAYYPNSIVSSGFSSSAKYCFLNAYFIYCDSAYFCFSIVHNDGA